MFDDRDFDLAFNEFEIYKGRLSYAPVIESGAGILIAGAFVEGFTSAMWGSIGAILAIVCTIAVSALVCGIKFYKISSYYMLLTTDNLRYGDGWITENDQSSIDLSAVTSVEVDKQRDGRSNPVLNIIDKYLYNEGTLKIGMMNGVYKKDRFHAPKTMRRYIMDEKARRNMTMRASMMDQEQEGEADGFEQE